MYSTIQRLSNRKSPSAAYSFVKAEDDTLPLATPVVINVEEASTPCSRARIYPRTKWYLHRILSIFPFGTYIWTVIGLVYIPRSYI